MMRSSPGEHDEGLRNGEDLRAEFCPVGDGRYQRKNIEEMRRKFAFFHQI